MRATIDIPIDILFVDSRCVEYIGKATISVNRDVLLSIPDESIVPYTLESMVSAICVSGTYLGNNQFKMTICVTTILKVLAEAEILIPSYGYCPIPPAEEFAESVCDEFFALPLFPPQSVCNSGTVATGNVSSTVRSNCNCGRGCSGLVQRQLQLRQQQQLIRFPNSTAPYENRLTKKPHPGQTGCGLPL